MAASNTISLPLACFYSRRWSMLGISVLVFLSFLNECVMIEMFFNPNDWQSVVFRLSIALLVSVVIGIKGGFC